MAVRTLALVGCALLVCVLAGGGYPQAPSDPIPVPGPTVPGIPAPQIVAPPTAAPAPAPKTVDQLIDNLTELRRQKAELEKKEQAVTAELREKLKAQRERLSKLGIEPAPIPQRVPVIGEAAPPAPGIAVPTIPAGSDSR